MSTKRKNKRKPKHNFSKVDNTVSVVERNILDTLSYSAIFEYSLTYHQLYNLLICKSFVDKKSFDNALSLLQKKKKIQVFGNVYGLNAHCKNNYLTSKEQSSTYMDIAVEISQKLARAPWIQLICVTGTVAASNASAKDDIDLFIVTLPNRLWISRLFVYLTLHAHNLYPSTKNRAGKICPNLYVTTTNMRWVKDKQNLYIAREILGMHPVVNKNDTYFRFLKLNPWVFTFFGNATFVVDSANSYTPKYSTVVNFVEYALYKLQTLYMRAKISTEYHSQNIIHFNTNDNTTRVLSAFSGEMSS
ncbi:hypothetical protein KC980_03165 [candidate division WWE3 bacterium]|uniref:Polymerase nucleotidyl transferase domain-containing protein n=1 Tax=candidate division WWE3 bacterium TaxID=2053526 RepID=A0A955ECM3_UNCKA|nr:hypothetical protein [candidate division WWE3 bacterium]